MKKKNCLQLVVLCISLLLITQNAAADFKSMIGDIFVKGLLEEVVNIHRSVKPNQWIGNKISLGYKDSLVTYIEVSNGVPVSIDLLDVSNFKNFKNNKAYRHYIAYHGEDVIENRYYFENKSNSEKEFYLIIRNNTREGSNVKIKVYRDVHKEEK